MVLQLIFRTIIVTSMMATQFLYGQSELNKKLGQINFVSKFAIDGLWVSPDIKTVIAWGSTDKQNKGGLGIYSAKSKKWSEFQGDFAIRWMDVNISDDGKYMAITNGDLPSYIPTIFDISTSKQIGNYTTLKELPYIRGNRKLSSGGEFIKSTEGMTKFITYSEVNNSFELWDISTGNLYNKLPYITEPGYEFDRFTTNNDLGVQIVSKNGEMENFVYFKITTTGLIPSTKNIFFKDYTRKLKFSLNRQKRQWITFDDTFLAYSDITVDDNKHFYFKQFGNDEISGANVNAVMEQFRRLMTLIFTGYEQYVQDQRNEIRKMILGNRGNKKFWEGLNQKINNLKYGTAHEAIVARQEWANIVNYHNSINR